jgi:hypothetical protein
MKTYTKLLDKTISTEMIEIGYNKTDKGYILINSLETPEGTEYWCQDNIFDSKLTYEAFKDIHNVVIKSVIGLNYD